MILIVKIYEHIFKRNIITQEVITGELTIDEEIDGFGIAKFTMPIVDIEEDNYVEIYEVNSNDNLIFRGYVSKVEPIRKQFGSIKIECTSEKGIMNKRKVLKDKMSYNVISEDSLPERPSAAIDNANYRIDQNTDYLYIYLKTILPEEGDPYHTRGTVPFNGETIFLFDQTNHLFRIDDGVVSDLGLSTSLTINNILDDLIDDYSTRGDTWSYEIGFTQEISMTIKTNDKYFDILNEVAKQCDAIWWIEDTVIKFKKQSDILIGTGNEYQEIYYNGYYPNSSNISSISSESTSTRCNIVIGQDQNKNKVIEEDVTDVVYGVASGDFRDGNLRDKTQRLLSDLNKKQRVYKVTVESNSIEANIGERIKLAVENTNRFYDINSDVIVIGKITGYSDGSKKVDYLVGELNVSIQNGTNRLYGIQKSLQLARL